MTNDFNQQPFREVVGIFSQPEELQNAIDELLSAGFDRAQLSLLASAATVEQKLGHRYVSVSALEDDPTIPRTAYVSTEALGDAEGGVIGGLIYVGATAAAGAVVASGGALAAAIAAATLAGGVSGLIGTILARWIGDRHARQLQEQIDRGGLLLWVRTWDAAAARRATTILEKHSGHDVHAHAWPEAETTPQPRQAASSPEGCVCKESLTVNLADTAPAS